MSRPVRKAVLPVAGLGTRFLPATKAMPKEMLTVVDRPLIQYAVDEAREAGIELFIFVTGRNKSVIADHFDIQVELEATLKERGSRAAMEALARDQLAPGQASFTRQQSPLGLGHAIWCARRLVGAEPFAVLLPDMLISSKPGCLAQMLEVYERTGGNVVSLDECDPKLTRQYGIVRLGEKVGDALRITEMIEKPAPELAPSNLYINGRYILQPEIFDILDDAKRGAGNEIQLTDAMIGLAKTQPFYGRKIEGRTFDCGSKVGFLAANVALALDRSDLADEWGKELRTIMAGRDLGG